MDSQLISLLNLLDLDGENILFEQRELGEPRTPFEMEKQLLNFVKEGKPKEMLAYYRNLFFSHPEMQISVGKLSRDKLRQLKYMAVSAIAIVCRVSMYSGVAEAIAYSRSDSAIQKIDKMNNANKILLLLVSEVYKYASLVNKSKVNATYSKSVRNATEYIIANLHSNISLEELSQFTSLNKDYFAKIFKKEVGETISDYILNQRIIEAKKMIEEGKRSDEISYILQFCSQSYFIKQFKKVTGITPHEYRAQYSKL